jgi:hypothetical protein
VSEVESRRHRLYAGRRVVLLTQHGKEAILGPVLNAAIGCKVERVDGFDTDQLGTFTREVPRAGTQLEAARRKASIGMDLAGCDLGLASEGAFVRDPFTGTLPWNVELVIFVDREHGLEVVGWSQRAAPIVQRKVRDWRELCEVAEEGDFPRHGLVLRPDDADQPPVAKGVADWDALAQAYHGTSRAAQAGEVFVESDLRAHCNPTRQAVIREAAEDLARRLVSECPQCGAPGYWISAPVIGLPCSACGAPTREPHADVWSCMCCAHRDTRERNVAAADPGRCDYCNP